MKSLNSAVFPLFQCEMLVEYQCLFYHVFVLNRCGGGTKHSSQEESRWGRILPWPTLESPREEAASCLPALSLHSPASARRERVGRNQASSWGGWPTSAACWGGRGSSTSPLWGLGEREEATAWPVARRGHPPAAGT